MLGAGEDECFAVRIWVLFEMMSLLSWDDLQKFELFLRGLSGADCSCVAIQSPVGFASAIQSDLARS
jgi:hypothetical protein